MTAAARRAVIERAASAIRSAAEGQVYDHGAILRYGEVTNVDPLALDLGDTTASEDDGNLTIGDIVRIRMDLGAASLQRGQTVVAMLMEDDDWHAIDVVSDVDLPTIVTGDSDDPSSAAGGDLQGNWPVLTIKPSVGLTGSPTATTASADTFSTRIATTQWFLNQKGTTAPAADGTAVVGVTNRWADAGHVHPTDTTRAAVSSPSFLGNPTAPTPASSDNSTSLATTAYVQAQGYLTASSASGLYQPADVDLTALANTTTTGLYARTGAGTGATRTITGNTEIVVTNGDGVVGNPSLSIATSIARIASPNFTGTPTAPTAAVNTNSTRIASTAFVINQGYAPLASPTFTGTPAAPTAAADTNTTQLATTGFVIGQGYLKSSTASATYAPLASPTFTGTPSAPTASIDTSTTQLATTAFVINQAYIKAATAATQFVDAAGDTMSGALTIAADLRARNVDVRSPAGATASLTFGADGGDSLAISRPAGAGAFSVSPNSWPGASLQDLSVPFGKLTSFLAGGGNRLYNSSFEAAVYSDADPGTTAAAYDGWSITGAVSLPGGASTVTPSSSSPDDGRVIYGVSGQATALKLVSGGAGVITLAPVSTRRPTVQPTAKITLSAYAASSTAGLYGRLRARFYDASNVEISSTAIVSSDFLLPSTGQQRFYLQSITAPATTQYASLELEVSATSSGQAFYFDGLQLESGEFATSYAPNPSETLPGFIDATALRAGSIYGDAIAATLSITGKLIQTATTPSARITLDGGANEFSIYDSSNVRRIAIDPPNGLRIWNAGGALGLQSSAGGLVTGTGSNRAEFLADGLTLYSSNNQTVKLDSSIGKLTLGEFSAPHMEMDGTGIFAKTEYGGITRMWISGSGVRGYGSISNSLMVDLSTRGLKLYGESGPGTGEETFIEQGEASFRHGPSGNTRMKMNWSDGIIFYAGDSYTGTTQNGFETTRRAQLNGSGLTLFDSLGVVGLVTSAGGLVTGTGSNRAEFLGDGLTLYQGGAQSVKLDTGSGKLIAGPSSGQRIELDRSSLRVYPSDSPSTPSVTIAGRIITSGDINSSYARLGPNYLNLGVQGTGSDYVRSNVVQVQSQGILMASDMSVNADGTGAYATRNVLQITHNDFNLYKKGTYSTPSSARLSFSSATGKLQLYGDSGAGLIMSNTGGLETASSGARSVFDTSGVSIYDASSVKAIQINTSGLVISSATSYYPEDARSIRWTSAGNSFSQIGDSAVGAQRVGSWINRATAYNASTAPSPYANFHATAFAPNPNSNGFDMRGGVYGDANYSTSNAALSASATLYAGGPIVDPFGVPAGANDAPYGQVRIESKVSKTEIYLTASTSTTQQVKTLLGNANAAAYSDFAFADGSNSTAWQTVTYGSGVRALSNDSTNYGVQVRKSAGGRLEFRGIVEFTRTFAFAENSGSGPVLFTIPSGLLTGLRTSFTFQPSFDPGNGTRVLVQTRVLASNGNVQINSVTSGAAYGGSSGTTVNFDGLSFPAG